MQRAERLGEVLKVTSRDESLGSDSLQGSNFNHSSKKKKKSLNSHFQKVWLQYSIEK